MLSVKTFVQKTTHVEEKKQSSPVLQLENQYTKVQKSRQLTHMRLLLSFMNTPLSFHERIS